MKRSTSRNARRQADVEVALLSSALRDLPDPDDLDFEGLPERITARPLHDLPGMLHS
ncbi:MAG TPA: hypothetical protein VM240_12570 [Verrucomicrobiae bacterium]|nr:hypothetical protein [Verrucomicrobiae bacterium]